MKRIAVSELKKGSVIGENINDGSGKLLVGAGTAVTATIIMRLEDNGLKNVMVLEPGEKISGNGGGSEGLKFLDGLKDKFGTIKNLNSVINEKEKNSKSDTMAPIRRAPAEIKKPVVVIRKTVPSTPKEPKENQNDETVKFLKDANDRIKKIVIDAKENGSIIPFSPTEELLKMFNTILSKKDVITVLMKMKGYDDYLYEHALYCGLMGMAAGEVLGYQKIAIFSLGLGGLMMDSGMIDAPKEIIDRKAVLKPEEREIVKKHPAKSYSITGGISQTTDIAKEIALYHHERVDGTGYPKGKKGEEISEYTRLMTIIDVYHALISERPYHPKKSNKEAFYTIFMYKGKQFDEKILAELIKKKGGK